MTSIRLSSNRNYPKPSPAKRKVGRPLLDTDATFRDYYVFVEVRRELTGASVLKICQNYKLTYHIIGSGLPFDRRQNAAAHTSSRRSYTRVLTGETLRYVYNKAQKWLRNEIAAHNKMLALFASCGAQAPFLTPKCEVEMYWRSLVDLEVASLQNDAWPSS